MGGLVGDTTAVFVTNFVLGSYHDTTVRFFHKLALFI